MEEAILTRAVRVTDPRAAAALRRAPSCRLIIHLAGRPGTAAEAARASGMPLNLACYHLRRLCALGLVAPAGERPRAGRPARLYQATGTAFFVPSEIADRTWGDELAEELRLLLHRCQYGIAGELFAVDEQGRMQVRKVPVDTAERPGGKAMEIWLPLRLDEETCDAMMDELHEVLARYEMRSGSSGGQRFLFHAAMAPREPG